MVGTADFDLFGEPSAFDSEAVFGLADNPFNPETFGNVNPRALDELQRVPLEIDRHPGLAQLFVAEAGPFLNLIKSFNTTLASAGFRWGDGRRLGSKSHVFRIFGPEGSGKSTLANVLVARLQQCCEAGELLVVKESALPAKLVDAVARTHTAVRDHGGAACCLVFDDVSIAIEDELHTFYEQLRGSVAVVMLEIIHDARDIRRPLPAARVGPRHLETSYLTRAQAAAFITRRTALFRTEAAHDHLPEPLAAYPFDVEDVGIAESNGAADSQLTLRQLSVYLNEGFVSELATRPTDERVTSLSESELRARLIRVPDVVQRLMTSTFTEVA